MCWMKHWVYKRLGQPQWWSKDPLKSDIDCESRRILTSLLQASLPSESAIYNKTRVPAFKRVVYLWVVDNKSVMVSLHEDELNFKFNNLTCSRTERVHMGPQLEQLLSCKGGQKVPMILAQRCTKQWGRGQRCKKKRRRKYLGQSGAVDGKACKRALNSERYKESDGNECREHFLCYLYKKERQGGGGGKRGDKEWRGRR